MVDPFFVVVNNGTNLVRSQFPDAVFVEADGPWTEGATVYDWRLVYQIDSGNRSAVLFSKDFEFTGPQVVPFPFTGSLPIPLPLPMGIIAAARLAQQAGFDGQIVYTTLRKTLYPRALEPQYIFAIPSQGVRVFVGIDSGKVTSEPLGEDLSSEEVQALVDPLFVVVNNGTRKVQAQFPQAVFLEADGPWEQDGKTFDWRLVYNLPGMPVRTAFLYSLDFQFTGPEVVNDVFLESNPIPLPLAMGILRAARLAGQAGFTGQIVETTLRKAETHPATPEPQYIFAIPSQKVRVLVGVDTGKVTSQPLGG